MWVVELLDDRVLEEIESLPADMRARFLRISELIQDYGLDRVREPFVKHVEGPLWEMRMKGRDGIARAFYVAARGRRDGRLRLLCQRPRRSSRHGCAC